MTLYEKLASVQAAIKAPKDLKNTFGGYNYRSAEGILDAVKPLLKAVNAAISLSDAPVLIGGRYYIEAAATFIDAESGDVYTVKAYAREAENKKGMDDGQLTGACSSYARKYALCGLLAIGSGEDLDAEAFHVAGKEEKAAFNNACKKAGKDPRELLSAAGWDGKAAVTKEQLSKAQGALNG